MFWKWLLRFGLKGAHAYLDSLNDAQLKGWAVFLASKCRISGVPVDAERDVIYAFLKNLLTALQLSLDVVNVTK